MGKEHSVIIVLEHDFKCESIVDKSVATTIRRLIVLMIVNAGSSRGWS